MSKISKVFYYKDQCFTSLLIICSDDDDAGNDKFDNSKEGGGSRIICVFILVALLISLPFVGIGAMELLFIHRSKFLTQHLK